MAAQGLGNDPISTCFKTIGKTEVKTGGIQNWTESIQNFVSLIPTDHTLKLLNENIVGASGPVNGTAGIWNVLKNENMGAHYRKGVSIVVVNLLAAAKPGFTRIQQDALGKCIFNEAKSLTPTQTMHFSMLPRVNTTNGKDGIPSSNGANGGISLNATLPAG